MFSWCVNRIKNYTHESGFRATPTYLPAVYIYPKLFVSLVNKPILGHCLNFILRKSLESRELNIVRVTCFCQSGAIPSIVLNNFNG